MLGSGGGVLLEWERLLLERESLAAGLIPTGAVKRARAPLFLPPSLWIKWLLPAFFFFFFFRLAALERHFSLLLLPMTSTVEVAVLCFVFVLAQRDQMTS